MGQEIAWFYAAHAARVAGGCSSSKAGAHRGERPDNQASRAAARLGVSLIRSANRASPWLLRSGHVLADPVLSIEGRRA
jgi:hypothetical protein